MTESNQDQGGILDRISEAIVNALSGSGDDATGSDASADAPTDVAGAASGTPQKSGVGGGTGANPRFGPSDGGATDILPGGRGIGTGEDDTMTEPLDPES